MSEKKLPKISFKFKFRYSVYLVWLLALLLGEVNASNPYNLRDYFEREPSPTIGNHLFYHSTRPLAFMALYRLFSPSLFTVLGYEEFYEDCRDLLTDLGGQVVSIQTADGLELEGMYFDPQKVKAGESIAFAKWKIKFANHPETTKLLDVDLDGQELTSLLGLPVIHSTPTNAIQGVIVCMGAGCCYEFDPHSVMIYANQGKHVLYFNYRGILNNEGTPDARGTFADTVAACSWLKTQLNCSNEELLIHGISMGGSNALYAGIQFPGMDVVVDRGFYSLSEVVKAKVPKYLKRPVLTLVEKFYGYRNDVMIEKVAGRVLIMRAKDDPLIPADHGERLCEKLVASKLSSSAPPQLIEAFKQKYFITVPGTHCGIGGGDKDYAWHRHPESFVPLYKFLNRAE